MNWFWRTLHGLFPTERRHERSSLLDSEEAKTELQRREMLKTLSILPAIPLLRKREEQKEEDSESIEMELDNPAIRIRPGIDPRRRSNRHFQQIHSTASRCTYITTSCCYNTFENTSPLLSDVFGVVPDNNTNGEDE